MSLLQEWQAPLVTQHEAMARIEHRAAALCAEIKGILREIVFSRNRL